MSDAGGVGLTAPHPVGTSDPCPPPAALRSRPASAVFGGAPAGMTRPLEALLQHAFDAAVASGDLPPGIRATCALEDPAHPGFGDATCRAAMLVARRAGRPALELAAAVVRHVDDPDGWLDAVDAAGPGFINVRVSLAFLRTALAATLDVADITVVPEQGARGPGGAALRSPIIAPGGSPRSPRTTVTSARAADALVGVRVGAVAAAIAALRAAIGEQVARVDESPAPPRTSDVGSRTVLVSADVRDGDVARAKAAVAAAGGDPGALTVVPIGPVDIVRRGRRLGGEEALAVLAVDGARLALLAAPADEAVVVDAAAFERAHIGAPIVAIRYALARIARLDAAAADAADLALLDDGDRDCLRAIGTFVDVVERAARRCEPERVVAHARGVAATFHRWYNRGRLDVGDARVRRARAALARGVALVLERSLAIAGEG